MRKMLLLLLWSVPMFASAQNEGMLKGNWKEVMRVNADGVKVTFRDTIQMEFMTGNEYLWYTGGKFRNRGTYKMVGDMLHMGWARLIYMGKRDNRILLRDDAGIHHEFMAYVPDRNTPAADRMERYEPVYTLDKMAGDWDVYKRTSDKPQKEIDYTRQIKKIEIFAEPKDGKWGHFYAGMDGEHLPSWFIESYADQVITVSGKDKRYFRVIKSEEGELILEEKGITYFFKHFQ